MSLLYSTEQRKDFGIRLSKCPLLLVSESPGVLGVLGVLY